jgi:hypothetical protein
LELPKPYDIFQANYNHPPADQVNGNAPEAAQTSGRKNETQNNAGNYEQVRARPRQPAKW